MKNENHDKPLKAVLANDLETFLTVWNSDRKQIVHDDNTATRIFFVYEEEGRGVTVARVPMGLSAVKQSALVEAATDGRDHHYVITGNFFDESQIEAIKQWYSRSTPGSKITWAIDQDNPWDIMTD